MGFDVETLGQLSEELAAVTLVAEDPEPGKLESASSRLGVLTYELETLASDARALPPDQKEGLKEIREKAAVLKNLLHKRIENNGEADTRVDFLLNKVNRMNGIILSLDYALGEETEQR